MSNDFRLNEALKNVAIHADPTWKYRDYDPLQQTNMNLHLTSRHLNVQSSKWTKLVPRTVRDSIPQSKLAKYGNYEYDEAREMSYTSNVNKYDRLNDTFDKDDADEPWMMEEIDDLIASYLSYNCNEESICHKNKHGTLPCSKSLCEKSFQSPFLEATSFDEMVLKLHITSPYIKKLWEPFYYPQYQPKYVSQSKSKKLILFSSTACSLFSSVETEIENSDWLEEITADKEGRIPMDLIETFNISSDPVSINSNYQSSISSPPKDDSPSKRLYSAVLQGGPPINQQAHSNLATSSTSYEFPPLRVTNNIEKICEWPYLIDKNLETAKRNQVFVETITNKQHKSTSANIPATTANTLDIQRPKTTTTFPPISYPNYQYLSRQQQANFIDPRLYSTNYISNTNVLNFRQTNYYPLLLHNAAVPYQQPFRPHYRHNVVYPQIRPQFLLTNQNLQTIHILPRPPAASPSYNHYRNTTSRYNTRPITPNHILPIKEEKLFTPHVESIVSKTVNAVLEESEPMLPLTETSSDELERQALEQYIPSSTDLFDELERQAIEEYDEDEASENWNSPPKYLNIAFGGCTRVKLVIVRCLEKVLGFSLF